MKQADAALPTSAGPRGSAVDAPERAPGFAVRNRYWILSAVILLLVGIQTINGQWSTDMWMHVAGVRELIAHPFDPANPAVLSGVSHPEFSPYSVVLGLLGHVTGWDAVSILSIGAMLNVVLLLVALRTFVLRVATNGRAPFWVLLFVLLLWGPRPYRFSGFFDLNSIGFVAPYPSTFATTIALFVLAAAITFVTRPSWLRGAGIAVGGALVVTCHPITGSWLAVAMVVIIACRVRTWPPLASFGAIGIATALLVLSWPYFSVLAVLEGGGDYASGNLDMYRLVFVRLLPVVVLGGWSLWVRWRADRSDLLAWMLAGGMVLYAWGRVGGNSTFGRSLAFVVLVLAIAAGDWVGGREAGWSWARASSAGRVRVVLLGVLLAVGAVMVRGGLVRMAPTALLPASVRNSEELRRPDDRYDFLTNRVGSHDVVLGMSTTDNLMVNALTGPTLVAGFVDPFVDDSVARERAVQEYLDPDTSADRVAIEGRYRVRFVLLDRDDKRTEDLLRAFRERDVPVVYEDDDFVLLRVPSAA